jgi:protein TonB
MHFKYQPYMVDNEPRAVKSLVMIEFQDGVGKRIEPPPPPPSAGVQGGIVGGVMSGGSMPPSPRSAPTPTGPVRISAGVASGMLIHKVDPVYPADARAANVQGIVVLHAIISEEGTVEKLDIISGPPALAAAAIDAVSQWRYRPYLLNDEPVKVETTININFTLTGPPATENERPQ